MTCDEGPLRAFAQHLGADAPMFRIDATAMRTVKVPCPPHADEVDCREHAAKAVKPALKPGEVVEGVGITSDNENATVMLDHPSFPHERSMVVTLPFEPNAYNRIEREVKDAGFVIWGFDERAVHSAIDVTITCPRPGLSN